MLTNEEIENWSGWNTVYRSPDSKVEVVETGRGYNVVQMYEGVRRLVLETYKEDTSSCYAKQTAIDEAETVYNTLKGKELLNE